MRLRLVFLVLLVPGVALGAEPKPVEVINLPEVQDVFVTNPTVPPAPSVSRFQFVGFTAATYTGNLGGFFGAARKCQIDFANSRMCRRTEVEETTTIPDPIPDIEGWWFDRIDLSCRWWSSDLASNKGDRVNNTGHYGTASTCDIPNSIACCALVP